MADLKQFNLQEAVQAIAVSVGEELASTRRRFRHWAGLDLVPATTRTGRGVGTRRRYDDMAVLLGATLIVLARHGIQGDSLSNLGNSVSATLRKRGFNNIRRDGVLLVIDLAVTGTIRAHLALPGAVPAPAPHWARLTINIGEIAVRVDKTLNK